jgi:hypothetical protein
MPGTLFKARQDHASALGPNPDLALGGGDLGLWKRPVRSALKPSQRHRLDEVIGALGEDQRRARPRRQDAFLEIG